MRDFWSSVGLIGILVLVCATIVFVVVFCVYMYSVNVGEANIVKIYKGDDLLYTGKKVFVSITSGGMTTTITIYRKLFPFLVVDKVYSDSNIRIE